MSRGRWAGLVVFAIYALIGVGAFLFLGWTPLGLFTFLAVCIVGTLIADWVFARVAGPREKQQVMEERVRDYD